jgi:hypothetical protein
VKYPGGRVVVKVSPESAELLREQIDTTGALVTGRRQFDLTHGWGGRHCPGYLARPFVIKASSLAFHTVS